MNALVYVLGARALEAARDPSGRKTTIPEASLGPLATTEETAAAWRQWAQAHDDLDTEIQTAEPSRLPLSGPSTAHGSPA